MKLQKLANDLKVPVDQVIESAIAVGVKDAGVSTDVNDAKKAEIEKHMAGQPVAEGEKAPADSAQEMLGLVNQLIVEETQSRMLRERLRPQVREMISAAIADYERYKTTPKNPVLKQAVEIITAARQGVTAPPIEISAIELPEIDLLKWGDDPTGSAASLLPGCELPMLEAG